MHFRSTIDTSSSRTKRIQFIIFNFIKNGFCFCFLCKLKQKFFLEIEYDKLYPSGSAPACIYGTPKIHKFSSNDSFPELCLIGLSIGTFNYNLAHFLCDLLQPLVPNDYSCKDSSFVSQIKNANLFEQFLVSYHVVFLLKLQFKKPVT